MRNVILFAAAVVSVATAAACEPEDWTPQRLRHGEGSATLQQLKLGQATYANYCAGCHGESGDGNGIAAKFLSPKPRDFRLGRLKFAAVESGQPPRDQDYLRIIDSGLAGTAMPSFRLLAPEEKRALVAYIKTFYKDWAQEAPGGGTAPGQDPWVGNEAGGIAEGRKTYHSLATCWSCHPAYETRDAIAKIHEEAQMPPPDLRPNLYEGEVKDSNWGEAIRAPDFLTDRIKTGYSVENLASIIASGVGGTAMPTWAGSLEPEQIWGLAYYVSDLALKRDTTEGRAIIAKLQSQKAPQ